MAQIDNIIQARKESLEKAKELGWNPYVSKFDKQQSIWEARDMEGQTVKTAGQITSFRTHGNIAFADLRDSSEHIQIFFEKNTLGDEAYKNLKLLDIGDYIGVEGQVMKTSAGEISIQPTSYTLLTKALMPTPDEFYGLKDVETRYRKRYLDLLTNPETREVFKIRTKVIRLFREYLDRNGFEEVETPVLQPLYGGTSAKPFTTHHNALDADFYLRIAVELYLKRLMVGGYERVYEVAKNFRNEGFSRQHNPEFTMLEFYWAYADYNDLMNFTEEMISYIIREVKGTYLVEYEGQEYDFAPGWERKTFAELFKEHLQINIDEITTEEALASVVKEKNLLDDMPVGYGFILDEVYKKHIRPHLKGPMFVTDYPVDLVPLAKRKEDDPTKAATFQLLVNGAEWLKAYNELNDPEDQKQRWLDDMKLGERGGEDFQMLDEDYIEALSYGMPPTAGWGLGVDRMVAFLANQHSIKDVILFPTMKPESSGPVQQAPDDADEQLTLTRDQAEDMLQKHLENNNLRNHCRAVGATMKALAKKLGGNPELWEMAGLLHDLDWEAAADDPSQHTGKTIEWMKESGEENETLVECILTHNYHNNGHRQPESLMEWSLYTCDELTGFIVAVALTRPDRKLASVETQSVLKKFPAKAFAKPVDREQIKMCEEKLGIPLEEFVDITLSAMQGISEDLGL